MQREILRDLVDLLAIPMKSKAHKIERIRRHAGDSGTIVGIVARDEELARIERRRKPTLERATQRPSKLVGRGREDENRLPDEPAVGLSRCIGIAFAGEFGVISDEPAGEEAGGVEFLPGREIVAHHDGDLGIEAHEHGSEPGWEGPS